jgi:hypothetical protein
MSDVISHRFSNDGRLRFKPTKITGLYLKEIQLEEFQRDMIVGFSTSPPCGNPILGSIKMPVGCLS